MYFAVIDIETTGGKASTDRITEIGIIKHDGKKEIARWHSLINPERSIPPFITNLTGIDNEMVATAPRFFEVAKSLVEFTDDCFFVAHNVGFDYGFIQQEFKTLGYTYNRKRFCTVKLSRKLLPGFKSYSLGKLCANLGISLANHHRALDDALATSKILEMLYVKDGFTEYIDSPREKLLSQKNITKELLNKVGAFPETVGVYYFLNKNQEIIYVGKSINIKKRIFTHLYNSKTAKSVAMKEEVTDFDFIETGSEMIALLKENEEIKKIQPKYNRALKKNEFNYGIVSQENQEGFLRLDVVRVTSKVLPIMIFTSKRSAQSKIEYLERKYGLCSRENSGNTLSSICLQCMGKCFIKNEEKEVYNERMQEAMDSLGLSGRNLLVVDSIHGKHYVAVVKQGVFCGYAAVEDESCLNEPAIFAETFNSLQDKDALNILRYFAFSDVKGIQLIEF